MSEQLILGSQSPRRKDLLKRAGFIFNVAHASADETINDDEEPADAVCRLAKVKARSLLSKFREDWILTADTVVSVKGRILGKPADKAESLEMLRLLSGGEHEVYSSYCLAKADDMHVGYDKTVVVMRAIEESEMMYYTEHYKPYDKAGAYGIQEWIGLTAIREIRGSYFNVMGLPIDKVYLLLREKTGTRYFNSEALGK